MGRALMDDLRQRARDAGCKRWYLSVKQDNAVAMRLYERCGLAIEYEAWALDIPWSAIPSLPRSAREVSVSRPTADDVASLAPLLAVDPTRIVRALEREGVVVLALGPGALGIAVFDPSFPGVFPIRVAEVGLAVHMLEAFRPHAKHDHAHVSVEIDRALTDALLAAGAKLDFAMFRMSGDL